MCMQLVSVRQSAQHGATPDGDMETEEPCPGLSGDDLCQEAASLRWR